LTALAAGYTKRFPTSGKLGRSLSMTMPEPHSEQHESLFDPLTSGLGRVHASIRLVALALLILLTGLTGGMVLERYVLQAGSTSPGAFADLEAAATVIHDNYYYLPTDPDARDQLDTRMREQAITGALSSLGDSYTRYLPPDESATAQEDLDGRYGGIGVDLAFGEDIVIVANVIPDTPADDAGIQRGDVLEEVDGTVVGPIDPNEVIRLLRGDIGSPVALTIVRPESGDVFQHIVGLEEIVVPPVTLRFIEDTSFAWLRITIFGDDTVAEVDEALSAIRDAGSTGIILDLRGNGGGWVESARATLGRFLDPSLGPAMFEDVTPGPGGLEPMPIVGSDDEGLLELPMIVLVDGGTASSAEIVAGALRDYDRALIVGVPTFGKGSVQRIYGFSDGASMRVTVAEWFTPSRGRIQDEGISPDLQVTASPHGSGEDPMLSTAVRLLESGAHRPSDLREANPATPDARATPDR
jgi:carboxyl-terminal processing protease